MKLNQAFLVAFLLGSSLHMSARADAFTECVGAGKRWDDRGSKCLPGREWKDQVPAELAGQINQEFQPAWKEDVRKKFTLDLSDGRKCHLTHPRAVVIFGSAGSGKSTIQRHLGTRGVGNDRFNLDEYVLFDGDAIRESNPYFKEYMDQFEIGYRNIVSFMKKHVHKVKNELIEEIGENRCNVVISTVAKRDSSSETAYIGNLEARGYQIQYYYVFVPYESTVPRAQNRAQWTGRAFNGSSDDWMGQVKFAQSLLKQGKYPITMIENSKFDMPRIIDQRELESAISTE